MKTIAAAEVTERVRAALLDINYHTPAPALIQLTEALESEPSPAGQQALQDIVANRRLASARKVPMCQDTGMAVVFVELGDQVRVDGGELRAAIAEGVRLAYRDGYLRSSIVAEPLFERKNTGTNTPPVIHFDLSAGDHLRLKLAAKGFGAENMSQARVLTPAEGVAGLKREVVRVVEAAGPNACPPIVVGVGVGGTLDMAALLAKRALLRPLGQRHAEARYAALELELLDLINATGIGPQGWGGRHTALDVRVEYYPTHIAGIPVAVNLDCHLQRHVDLTF